MKLKNTDRPGAIARGLRIKQARLAKGLNQAELAKSVDTTNTTISKIESGRVLECGSGMLGRIATILGTTFEWLEYGKESSSIVIHRGKNQTVIEDLPNYQMFGSFIPLFTWDNIDLKKSRKELYAMGHPFVQLVGKGGLNAFALYIEGQSMISREAGTHCFNLGDILYFDPDKEISNSDFVCARAKNDKRAVFRQYIFDSGKTWLMPLNRQFPAIEVINNNFEILAALYDQTHPHEKPDVALHKFRNKKKMIKENI